PQRAKAEQNITFPISRDCRWKISISVKGYHILCSSSSGSNSSSSSSSSSSNSSNSSSSSRWIISSDWKLIKFAYR
ncbi:hypothetical protein V1478_008391, partial [Vespula squamosa]